MGVPPLFSSRGDCLGDTSDRRVSVVASQQVREDHNHPPGVPESKGMGGAARLPRRPVGSGPLQRPRGGVKHSDGKNWKPEG